MSNSSRVPHRVELIERDGHPILAYSKTGTGFLPLGANYVGLGQQRKPSGVTIDYHDTFNVGSYRPAQVQSALQAMAALGYNTVRVFLNGMCETACAGRTGGGISRGYARNVADFIRKANDNGITVILTTDSAPDVGGYTDRLGNGSNSVESINLNYFTRLGVDVNARFWRDFILAISREGAPLGDILAYELRNEFRFDNNLPPFTLTSGKVSTPNGKTYDMANPPEKAAMAADGAVYWVDRVAAAVRAADPNGLVAVGVPQIGPDGGSEVSPVPASAVLRKSTTDILDVHFYPGTALSFGTDAEETGLSPLSSKVLIMGELGVTHQAEPTDIGAIQALRQVIAESCADGVRGWLLWTWDTVQQEHFWTALESKEVIGRFFHSPLPGGRCPR